MGRTVSFRGEGRGEQHHRIMASSVSIWISESPIDQREQELALSLSIGAKTLANYGTFSGSSVKNSEGLVKERQ